MGTFTLRLSAPGFTPAITDPITISAGGALPTTITLTAHRLSSGTAATVVSSGIPLRAGQLFPAAIANVSLWQSGVERACYVEALAGRHPDGSLKSLLLQADAGALTYGSASGGWELRLATAPLVARRTKTTVTAIPTGAFLCADATHMCECNLFGPLAPKSSITTGNGWPQEWVDHSNDYATYADIHWTALGDAATRGTAANYDYGATLYAEFMRTGSSAWRFYERACRWAASYRAAFIDGAVNSDNAGASSGAWYVNPDTLGWHYWLTGDEQSRTSLQKYASFYHVLSFPSGWAAAANNEGDDRAKTRTLQLAMWATLLQCAPYGNYTGLGTAQQVLGWVLGKVQGSGLFGGTNMDGIYGAGQAPYMAGMLAFTLGEYYDYVDADVRLPAVIDAWLNASATYGWVGASKGWVYHPYEGGSPVDTPLNLLVASAWARRRTSSDRSFLVTVMQGLRDPVNVSAWSLTGQAWAVKQFDQSFWRAFTMMGHLAR